VHVFISRIRGQHDDARVGKLLEDRVGRLQPIHDRHAEVHENEIRTELTVFSRASSPLAASATTCNPGSVARKDATPARISG